MRFVAAVSLLGTLPIVSSFVPQGSLRRALFSAPTARQWARFAEKQQDDDSQVMVDHGASGDLEFTDDVLFEENSFEEEDATEVASDEVAEAEVIEKDEQTLFDEANMQKAIQMVLNK